VNWDYCGHVYAGHKLKRIKIEKALYSTHGKYLIMGCNCASYVDKIEKIDEEPL
jgi:hypothetical protein